MKIHLTSYRSQASFYGQTCPKSRTKGSLKGLKITPRIPKVMTLQRDGNTELFLVFPICTNVVCNSGYAQHMKVLLPVYAALLYQVQKDYTKESHIKLDRVVWEASQRSIDHIQGIASVWFQECFLVSKDEAMIIINILRLVYSTVLYFKRLLL